MVYRLAVVAGRGVLDLLSGAKSTSPDPTPPAATPQNIYTTQVPTTPNANDGGGITLASRFVSDTDGQVSGVRFYTATTLPVQPVGLLYNDGGTELARVSFTNLVAGWNTATFTTPVDVTAGTAYRVAYWSNGPYVASSGLLPITNGHLTASSGYFVYNGSPTFPDGQTTGAYFADVVYTAGSIATATAPATPAAPNVAAGDSKITVSWAAPASGGSPITGYDIQSFIGSTGGTIVSVGAVTSAVISGLTNGTTYTVKFRAKNAVGTSDYSTASAAVTPVSGPTFTGYPSATTTGVPAGTTLTPYTGPSTITTAGTIIDSKTITSALIIKANNVTIKNCRIAVPNAAFIILNDSGNTGFLLQDTEIDGLNTVTDGAAIGGRNYTALRCNIHGTGDGVKLGDNVTIQDSYIHDLYGGNDSHNDGMQCSDGTNVRILHNTILPVYTGATSCIIIKADFGPITDLIFDSNLVGGGGWCVYGGNGFSGLPDATAVQITNNKFTTAYFPNGGAFGPITNTGAGVTVTGNTWADGPKAGQAVV